LHMGVIVVNDIPTSITALRLRALSDDELLKRLSALLGQSRRIECELVAHIGEVDERRLYAREACDSMFVYCTEVLHLSEHEAYLRIAAARAAREHPMLLAMLRRRTTPPRRHRQAGAASDPREPGGPARARHSQIEAADRSSGGGPGAAAQCPHVDPEAPDPRRGGVDDSRQDCVERWP